MITNNKMINNYNSKIKYDIKTIYFRLIYKSKFIELDKIKFIMFINYFYVI